MSTVNNAAYDKLCALRAHAYPVNLRITDPVE